MSLPTVYCRFESIWRDLKDGIEKIFSNNLSRLEYIRLYTLLFDFSKSQEPRELPLYKMLHRKLRLCFRQHVEDVCLECENLFEESLLRRYEKLWNIYTRFVKVLRGVCAYPNQHWTRPVTDVIEPDEKQIYPIALLYWKDYFLETVKKRMSTAMLQLIQRERKGEMVDTGLIQTVLDSYVEIGTNCLSEWQALKMYKDFFEEEFLCETMLFYASESDAILSTNTVSEYMKKTEIWRREEQRRIQLYMHPHTLETFELEFAESFIIKYIDIFHAEFETLLANNQTEDLKLMYHILSRASIIMTIPGWMDNNFLDNPRRHFKEYVTTEGLKALKKYDDDYDEDDPKAYINIILDIYQRFNSIVITAFECEEGFVKVFDKACRNFINKNAVTESSGSSSKSAELLAKYCDLLLQKKLSYSEEMETVDNLNQAMSIFKYIIEKDIFQNFYIKSLAKRLIQQTSASGKDDAETIMISKLSETCGFEYTNKLQRMFQDVCVSRDLSQQFKKFGASLNVDFSINVISWCSWPFDQSPQFNLPQELEQSFQQFTTFYCSQFKGRKLTWLHDMSRGELVANCFNQVYTFQALTLQMAVLLEFNTQNALTFSQLRENTNIQSDILLQVLKALSGFRLLKYATNRPVTKTTLITLNGSYENKKLKVNIIFPIKPERRSEAQIVHQYVEKDRKLIIQAAVVRIAKARKVIKHHSLVSQVIKQLSSRFKPKIPEIKKSIEILIEKEYLKRARKNSYSYVA